MKPSGKSEQIHDDEFLALIFDCMELLLPTFLPEQVKVVHAIDMDGISPQSVAGLPGLSPNQVTTLLVLGRQSLKDSFGVMHTIGPEHGLAGCDCHLQGKPNT